MADRVHKSLLNAKVNLVFFVATLFISFFSRKIFLDCLGAEFIGLSGTLGNILGLLNLAEFGIGTCISYFLFKPLQSADRKSISEIMSVFGYVYRWIGTGIAVVAILISLFFPFIFKQADIGLGITYFAFYSFLISSLIGYFINYKQILLTADQKNYVVVAYFQTGGIIKSLIQIALAWYTRNVFLWVTIELLFGFINCWILNWKIRQVYPCLTTEVKRGKELMSKYPDIFLKTKQIFVHRIKDFLLNKSDEILVFIFVSLKMVAYYGNYLLIINKIILFMNVVSDGMGAGVGNLVAEGNEKNTLKVFWELTAIRFYVTGIVCFGLFYFTDALIEIWLGSEYLLDNWILYLLLINLFIMFTRGVVQMYIHSYGLYADTWSAWVEVILNLVITIVCAMQWGILGIVLGKVISSGLVALFWKPYYLYRDGFHLSCWNYWKGMFPYYALFFLSLMAFYPLVDEWILPRIDNFLSLLIHAAWLTGLYAVLYLIIMYICTIGTRHFVHRIPFLSDWLNSKK